MLRLPSAARTVFVADPAVADVQMQQADSIYLTAKNSGTTVLYAVDAAGHILLKKFVEVKGPVAIIKGAALSIGGQPGPAPAPTAQTQTTSVTETRTPSGRVVQQSTTSGSTTTTPP